MPERIPQSTTIRVPLYAVLSSDHITPATSKTITVTISLNGAGFGDPSGGPTNASEVGGAGNGNGWYYVDLSATDTGTLGPLIVIGVAATIDNVSIAYNVVKATNGGLTAIPDTAVTTNASLLTSGTGSNQISVSSGRVTANVDRIDGAAWATHTAGMTPSDLRDILGVASAGTAGYVGIDWAQIANPNAPEDFSATTVSAVNSTSTVNVTVNPCGGFPQPSPGSSRLSK